MRAEIGHLRPFLEEVYNKFHTLERVEEDPLKFPRSFVDPQDIEVAGLIASSFAFGKANAFMAKVAKVLERLGESPARRLLNLTPSEALALVWDIRHRFVGPEEIASLLLAAGSIIREEGSIKSAFLKGYCKNGNIIEGLKTLAASLHRASNSSNGPGFLVPLPSPTHASKRLLMFLRWMVRDDGIDLGLWPEVPPSSLLIPLDTHVYRISGFLGLIKRNRSGPTLRDSIELTKALATFDKEDPVRFDFALAHLGISRTCRGHFHPLACPSCPIFEACLEAHKHPTT